MKKLIFVCADCDLDSTEFTLYECPKCKETYCLDCIVDHLVDEGLIKEFQSKDDTTI